VLDKSPGGSESDAFPAMIPFLRQLRQVAKSLSIAEIAAIDTKTPDAAVILGQKVT